MKKITYSLALLLCGLPLVAQTTFTDATSSLNNANLKSGVAIAITDMNADGLDDLIRLSNGNNLEIEFQQADGSFERLNIGDVDDPWGITIADVDQNGFNDIVAGGFYDDLKLVKASSDGSSFVITTLGGPNIFLQAANFADIDNDGFVDFFGCSDESLSSPYKNDGSGSFSYDLGLINAESSIPSDNSGNYGSIWTDYDNDGDLDLYISKCRQSVIEPMDGRRLNLLFQNDGANNFTEVAESAGLRPGFQSWATNFEDIDNDGDFDAVMVNHGDDNQIYENNGDGTFTDITATTGINAAFQTVQYGVQLAMEDLDNNGFIDIVATTLNGTHGVFFNNGDGTWNALTTGLNTNGNDMQSVALGDMNNDGFIDMLGGYANGFNNPSNTSDQLFLNNGNGNNWSKIILEGTESNINGIGARVEIEGAWGSQVREVRAGESYGTQNSLTSHFGIGTATEIDKIIVTWPSGIIQEIIEPDVNETILIVEKEEVFGITDNTIQDVRLFPNPANNTINISLRGTVDVAALRIFDISGKEIQQNEIDPAAVNTIDISSFASGLYFANIGSSTVKFVKQ